MGITLTLGDLSVITAIVLIFASLRDYRAYPTPRQRRTERQLDAIMKHLGLPEPFVSRPGALSNEIVALLAAGRRIEAIKRYRQETGEGLKEANFAIQAPADPACRVS